MKLNYYIQRLQKIISSLKLFHILFLNCFLADKDINKNNFDENELFDNFFSFKVQTMRKKLLIEWCIEEEKEYLKKKDLVNKNKELKKGLLSKQIISFGQIKTAINSNNKKNIFINSKLSNLDNQKKVIYQKHLFYMSLIKTVTILRIIGFHFYYNHYYILKIQMII